MKSIQPLLFFFLLIATSASIIFALPPGSQKFFSGYKLYRFNVQTQSELDLLLKHVNDHQLGLDVWTEASIGDIDVLVPPKSVHKLSATLLNKLSNKVILSDLQTLFDDENEHRLKNSMVLSDRIENNVVPSAEQVFKDYQDVSVYNAFLESIPGIKKIEIGRSYLDKPIYGFEFGSGNKSIVYHGGIHAREWISPSTVVYITWQLATNPDAQRLRDTFKFVSIPVLNVDGYHKTRSFPFYRLWRKNAQPNGNNPLCVGTDPNRNFGFKWNAGGSSGSPCSPAYGGPEPFSAPESKAIADFVKSRDVISYIDFHAYSQLLMFPWGYDCGAKIAEFDELNEASKLAVDAIKAFRGKNYRYGDICNTIYQASGNSVDYMYAEANVKYSYTIELPPAFSLIVGFLLPAKEIVPVGQETYAGIHALWSYVADHL